MQLCLSLPYILYSLVSVNHIFYLIWSILNFDLLNFKNQA